MRKFIAYLMQDEVLKLISGYFLIGAFVGIVIALFGMIWLGVGHSDYVFPKLLGTNIIILWLAKAGWNVL